MPFYELNEQIRLSFVLRLLPPTSCDGIIHLIGYFMHFQHHELLRMIKFI